MPKPKEKHEIKVQQEDKGGRNNLQGKAAYDNRFSMLNKVYDELKERYNSRKSGVDNSKIELVASLMANIKSQVQTQLAHIQYQKENQNKAETIEEVEHEVVFFFLKEKLRHFIS